MPWRGPSRRHTLSFARASQIVDIRRNNVEPGISYPRTSLIVTRRRRTPTACRSQIIQGLGGSSHRSRCFSVCPVVTRLMSLEQRAAPERTDVNPVDSWIRVIPCCWSYLTALARVLRHNGQRSGLSPRTSTWSKVRAMMGAVWSSRPG